MHASKQENPVVEFLRKYPHHKRILWDSFMDQLEELVQKNDPSADNNAALKEAMELGDMLITNLLLENKNVYKKILGNRRHILEYNIQDSTYKSFEDACASGNLDYIISFLLLSDMKIDSKEISKGLEIAANSGHLKVVKLLVWDSRLDLDAWKDNPENNPIVIASSNGHVDVISFLQDWLDPSVENNLALFMAAFNNHLAAVNLLLNDSRVDPSSMENQALLVACYAGNTQIVERLLQDHRIFPSLICLRDAFENNHFEIVNLLCNRLDLDPNNPDGWK